MNPTNNPLTIVKQRTLVPSLKKVYARNIKTWFDKKQNPINSSDTLVGMILQSYDTTN